MKRILGCLKDYRLESILGPLFKLLEACLELLVPFVIAAIIDKGIPSGDAGYILKKGAVLIGLGLTGLLSSVTAQYFAAKAAVGLSTKLRHALFAHIQKFSYANLDRIGASTLITRLTSDINQVQSGVNLGLRLFLRSPFIVFGSMVMAFLIDARCAMIFAYAIPVLALIVFGIMLITMPIYKKTQAQLDGILLQTRENLSGVRILRAFGMEDTEIESFSENHRILTGLQTLSGRISALLNPFTYIAINAALVLLLNTGSVRVNAGIITQGQLVALMNYLGQILVELIKLANLIITTTKAAACGSRINAVLSIRPGMTEPKKPIAATDIGLVEFDHVSVKYSGTAAEAVSDISIIARRGQMIGIIGGTGSGKSTLANLIPRFYDASSGTVKVNGADVRRQSLEQLRACIGIVPQKAMLFRGSIRENLLWGNPDADDDTLMEAVRTAQAEDILLAKGGLDAEIEQNGRNLSGGQKQRLTIARALVRRPQILILDDSSSALDYATDSKLRMALRKLPYRPTIFIISQRTSSVRFADKIIVMDDGRAVDTATHEELLSRCRIYRDIYDTQFKSEVQAS